MSLIAAAENGRLPDWLVRIGIRRLLRRRLDDISEHSLARRESLLRELQSSPVAIETAAANDQHYEVPAEFFERILGRHLKYSCGYWPDGVTSLDDAESESLGLVARHAELADGMDILELGCGWGAFSLWAAETYPGANITAISNSNGQREFIIARAAERGIDNLRVLTADMAEHCPEGQFDRIVSIEMFEHMRNYAGLLERLSACLRPDGRLFVHVFSHREHAYKFEDAGDDDWMARHFFTGGLMPSRELIPSFDRHLRAVDEWHLDGSHYHRTCEAWLQNLDANRDAIAETFANGYPVGETALWIQRWRMFIMACSELFAYDGGSEWGVSHYLLAHRESSL